MLHKIQRVRDRVLSRKELILKPRPIFLNKRNSVFVSPQISLKANTKSICIQLQRPTSKHPIKWDSNTRLQIDIFVKIYFLQFGCTGLVSGGVRYDLDLKESCFYSLIYNLPIVNIENKIKRICQHLKPSACFFKITLLSGNSAETYLHSSKIIRCPKPFNLGQHKSVTFDAASSAQEINGDGVLSLSHTSSGDDRAVFGGVSVIEADSTSSTSLTYNGVSMTEQWDFSSGLGGRIINAGYTQVGQPTGAQSVVSTVLTASPNRHMLGVVSMSDVDPVTPVGAPATNSGNSTTASVSVGGVGAEDLVLDNLSSGWSGAIPAVNETERYEELADLFTAAGNSQNGVDGGAMGHTRVAAGITNEWNCGGIAFKMLEPPIIEPTTENSIHTYMFSHK